MPKGLCMWIPIRGFCNHLDLLLLIVIYRTALSQRPTHWALFALVEGWAPCFGVCDTIRAFINGAVWLYFLIVFLKTRRFRFIAMVCVHICRFLSMTAWFSAGKDDLTETGPERVGSWEQKGIVGDSTFSRQLEEKQTRNADCNHIGRKGRISRALRSCVCELRVC